MARRKSTSPSSFLHQVVPEAELRSAAVALGVVQRVRKVDVVAFLLATVLAIGEQGASSIAAMRRRFVLRGGHRVARSSFWSRFTPAFGELVKWLVEHLQEQACRREPSRVGALSRFKDILAVDSTVITVNPALKWLWPGTRRQSRPAAIKVHTWIRALTGELLKHRITGERFADSKAFGIDWSAAGTLFLFDRGYSSASLWWRIDRVGAYFLTRLPGSYWPKVVSENRRHRGRARRLLHRDLREASETLKRKVIDVNCVFRAHVRRYRRCRGRYEWPEFRVVGLWNEQTREYHFYVTNAPVNMLPAELVTDCYRLRWEVELFYRTCKSHLGLDELRTSKPHIVETLVRASLIRSSVAMQAKRLAEHQLPDGLWVNPESWVAVWRMVVPQLLLDRRRRRGTKWQFLALLAVDPNRKRVPTRVKLRRTIGLSPGLSP